MTPRHELMDMILKACHHEMHIVIECVVYTMPIRVIMMILVLPKGHSPTVHILHHLWVNTAIFWHLWVNTATF